MFFYTKNTPFYELFQSYDRRHTNNIADIKIVNRNNRINAEIPPI